jgi:hypothetical protein
MFANLTSPVKITVLNWDSSKFGSNMFNSSYIYKGNISITGKLTDASAFQNARIDGVLTFPSSLTNINTSLIDVKIVNIASCETVPTLNSVSNIYSYGIHTEKVIIGHGMMSQYAAATNWSTIYAYGLLEEATE